jgi:hypothetical protein
MTLRRWGAGTLRRAIAAAVVSGVLLGGTLATPAFATVHGAGKAAGKARPAVTARPRAVKPVQKSLVHKTKVKTTAAKAGKAATATKTVVYAGYELKVPASWPVYRLDEHPGTCVRYDVHAVYLGTPGANMYCPAGLVGRTAAVSIVPGQAAVTGSGAGSASSPDGVDGAQVQTLTAVHSAITENTVQHDLDVALGPGGMGATVTGTYGADPTVIKQVLSTLRPAPANAPDTAPSGPASEPSSSRQAALYQHPAPASAGTRAAGANSALAPAAAKPVPSPTYTSWKGVPPHWPIEIIAPAPKPTPPPAPASKPAGGFDTCTAPSLATMSVFRSVYADAGIYLGGANSACAYGNLSASWIKSAAAIGYGMLPTYVGPQAPCWDGTGVLISAGSAAAQGASAGADAVSDAQTFGLAKGSPIYYDMEAFTGSTSCTNAVLAFLGAWDRRVAAAGYLTAVYSSMDSGIADIQAAAVAKTPGFTPPDAIWFALWDNVATLSDGTLDWPLTDRSKQYLGNVNRTIGGITLDIDKDIVGGPVAR